MIQTIFSFMVIKKNELNNIDLKQRIVNVLITFMLNNKTNEPGLYAACEVLMCLQIPEDLVSFNLSVWCNFKFVYIWEIVRYLIFKLSMYLHQYGCVLTLNKKLSLIKYLSSL